MFLKKSHIFRKWVSASTLNHHYKSNIIYIPRRYVLTGPKSLSSHLDIKPASSNAPPPIKSENNGEDSRAALLKNALDNQDQVLRKVFDDETFWHKFNESSTKSASFFNFNASANSSGLFQNPYLKTPKGLKEYAFESLEKAKLLVDHIINDNSPEGYQSFIRNLDRLSDILCRAIDLAEFVRFVHPNKSFVNAAQECHEELYQYMNVLNTCSSLYEKLDHVLKTPEIYKKLSQEELSVGNLLLTDFLKSGINMDEQTKANFVELSQHISLVGQHFINGVSNSGKDHILVKEEQLSDLDPSFKDLLKKNSKGYYKISTYGRIPFDILRTSKNEEVRKKIWLTLHQTPDEQIQLLESFIKYRGVLAHLLKQPSYSHYQLEEKMAKTPDNVMSFLQKLLKQIHDDVLKEIKILYKYQKNSNPSASDEEIISSVKPWDRDYLTTLHMMKKKSTNTADISSFFSVGTVVQGLSNLFKSIYGISLVPAKTEEGECWSPDVRKFNVVSENEGLIGIIYLDLFYRPNKTSNPAHFTVCCSRKIYPEELNKNDVYNLKLKTIHTNKTSMGELVQLPVISLVCCFAPDQSTRKTLLSLYQVETLFHEMGHAMHSMLGRTNLHNVSGTRCATDFVELPSILMEHFARDPRVLTSFARHHETNEKLPLKLLESYQQDSNFLKNYEIFGQIKMALLDQILHSNIVFDKNFNSVDIYHQLEKKLKVFADLESNWPGKFGHLFSYGSFYYSYLFDRAIASKIWQHLFEKDPLSRENGEKFKNNVLKWGGSKNPWELLSEALDDPRLKRGDSQAMEIIGNASDL
ncbi:hypothetical protein PACTADRAFT_51049 [Pachysolen tannophilus NRRL Y-2460]|uniref:Mitochondrial intermediate peptidase n=1 Tax=Pachysolen tannophilus NRRL Y-2460 TaxID=669874 RepID=A0A1E4TQY5_PACTA|nr:hypothetical protein PACTADRAFT_51049 [Pachysolen tannophilus NRRL Y-2460]